MAEQVISPDLGFVKDVIASGGESLKKCFQCATCSVVCNLAPDDKPFPRKEMIYAQWGLKDRLISNPDIWLCHQCSDCTAYCPRGAKPGEVLGAVRKLAIEHYSFPGFLGKAVGKPQFLVLLFVIPIVILFIVLASLGNLNLSAIPRGEDGGIVYAKFMPEIYIEVIYIAVSAFVAFSFVMGIRRYWKDMGVDKRGQILAAGSILGTIASIIGEILAHKRFEKCELTKERKISHFLVFYSFIGLAITAGWGVFYLYILHRESPYPLTDPMKWLGNASALALLIGITLVVIYRNKNKGKAGIGSYFDWLLIVIIAAIAVTGMAAQCLRLADVAVLAYPVYFLHLVFVFFLFAYAPYSKMAHMVYRTVAMVFTKHAEKGVEIVTKAG
ncbi:MAG: quinone-interacting membrane-bound oxidoreductase complex subunit QmoC [Nitrospirota bacterium]